MEDNTIRRFCYIVPILILISINVCVIPELYHNSEVPPPNVSTEVQEPTVLNIELIENQSMNWFRARLVFNVTTDIPINMSYTIIGIGSNMDKVVPVNSSVFIVKNISSLLQIFILPKWSVFPGSFHYRFTLYYINATTQIPQISFEIISGIFQISMGIPLSIILGIVLMTGISIIALRPVRLRKPKITSISSDLSANQVTSINTPSNTSAPMPPTYINGDTGTIQCPECNKRISEGSAFCPECGYHIPRFLRTKG